MTHLWSDGYTYHANFCDHVFRCFPNGAISGAVSVCQRCACLYFFTGSSSSPIRCGDPCIPPVSFYDRNETSCESFRFKHGITIFPCTVCQTMFVKIQNHRTHNTECAFQPSAQYTDGAGCGNSTITFMDDMVEQLYIVPFWSAGSGISSTPSCC